MYGSGLRLPFLIPLFAIATGILTAQQQLPVIDMHLHAHSAALNGPPPVNICASPEYMPHHDPKDDWPTAFMQWMNDGDCPNILYGASSDEELMKQTLALLEKNNIYGVTSGPFLADYVATGSTHILAGRDFSYFDPSWTPGKLEADLSSGNYRVFAEVAIQYNGVSPSDPVFEPYAAIAEKLDIPMGIHMGTGPPGAPYLPGMGNYRSKLHSPLLLEELLLKHPGLRVYVMHAGYPMIDDLLTLLWGHPQVYAGLGAICFAIPRKAFHTYLQRIVEAGYGKRVMFGSDQMNWPGAIETGIEAIETADFLTPEQKRDILYNNAARFLRLPEEEIAKHHAHAHE